MRVKALQLLTDYRTGLTHFPGEVFELEPKDRVAAAARRGVVEALETAEKEAPEEPEAEAEPEPEAPKEQPKKAAKKTTAKKVSKK